ncbi:MAG: L,D-transpeptidase family protein, partial [Patescibacteria group bacterium]
MRTGLAILSVLTFIAVAVLNLMGSVPDIQTNMVVDVVDVARELPLPGYPGCVARVDQLAPVAMKFDHEDPRLEEDRVIVILKGERRLMLFSNGAIRRDREGAEPDCWKIGLGWLDDGQDAGVFDKHVEGDRRTPEGWFLTSDRPTSSYENAIIIHYPDERHAKAAIARGSITRSQYDQIARAQKRGTVPPQNTSLGGNILIHGGGSSSDWTLGCVALDDWARDELRNA